MEIEVVAKNHLKSPKKNVFTTNNFENYDLKAPNPLYGLTVLMSFPCHLYVICMRSYFIYMYSMSSVCHSYVPVCHPYVTRMYSYAIRMSLVCDFTMNQGVSHTKLL